MRIIETSPRPISRERAVRLATSHVFRSKKACAITCIGCTEVRLPSLTRPTDILSATGRTRCGEPVGFARESPGRLGSPPAETGWEAYLPYASALFSLDRAWP